MSIAEKTPEGIIYKSSRTIQVPDLDVLTLLFESEQCYQPDDKILHLDAADGSKHLTKGALREGSKKVAHVLRHRYGIGAAGPNKDVVFIMTTGHFMVPLLFCGILAADGIYSAISPAATPDELAYQLKVTGATVLLCNSDTKDVALAGAQKAGLARRKVLSYKGDRVLELEEAATGAKIPISNEKLQWRRITDRRELENSVVTLLFSSGTTGLPKALKQSHRNLVAASTLCLEPSREFNAFHRPKNFEYVSIAHLPIAHVAGCQSYLVNLCYIGGRLYWMPRFDLPKLCEYFRKYKANSMFTVPPIYLLISKSPLVTDHFDTWLDAVAGAAPMGEELEVEVSKKLGKGSTKVRQTWGLSETTGSITMIPLAEENFPRGTVGSLVANHEARIVDDDGNDVEPGQEGELLVRGPVVVKGYWNKPEADAASFKNGWFYTGDIGLFRDGWFFILDRKKELIKYKGNQVAPAELEGLLLSHPSIMDAAVIGVPGDGTELPRAYVVADAKQVSAKEIKDFVAKRVARYKQLRGGVLFVAAIPKSPSGKILRKELREMAKKEALSSQL